MAKEILDIYIEQGYPYEFELDMNSEQDEDLEDLYTCYFYCDSIGSKPFSVVNNAYVLILSGIDTNKLDTNLEDYVVYVVNNTTSIENKMLSGRIILDKKGR